LGVAQASERGRGLEQFLSSSLGKKSEVSVAESYETLAKDLLSGKVDAAWAPPFVCARIEAMGVRVLARGVRDGTSSYRAALICREEVPLTVDKLVGMRAVWTDRDSVGGYLLPMAHLRSKGFDPSKIFFAQEFAGSYLAAVEAVHTGKADVTSVFAPPSKHGGNSVTGIEQIAPHLKDRFRVVTFTDEAPNDGVAVSMSTPQALVMALEKALMALEASKEGSQLLRETFNAERFEPAPRMSYRALYRVALASL
jgi:phosphonate transport system substrate-binding protein